MLRGDVAPVAVSVIVVAAARGGGGARVVVVPSVGRHSLVVDVLAVVAAVAALSAVVAVAASASVQERVLELDVPVGDPQLVAELHRDHQLLEKGPGDRLREAPRDRLGPRRRSGSGSSAAGSGAAVVVVVAAAPVCRRRRRSHGNALPVPQHVLEHVPAARVLHHDREVPRRQEHLLEADDVRVARAEPVVDDLAQRGLVDARAALEELDGDAAAGPCRREVLGEVDEAKGSLFLFLEKGAGRRKVSR